MNFAFTEEQEMLRASARALMQDRYPIERVAALADGAGFDRSEWSSVVDLGWTAVSAPQDQGGAGLGFLEEMVIAEELGRALYPGPFLSCVVLGLHALRTAGAAGQDLTTAVLSGERIATVAWAGTDGTFDADPAAKLSWDGEVLTGVRLFVPDLAAADLLVTIGGRDGVGNGIWAVDRDGPGVSWRELATVDATRRVGEVELQGAPASLLAVVDAFDLEAIRDRALAAMAAEAVGLGSRALEIALVHARTREQFGRPIGTFQAVAHQLAEAFMVVETARSLAYWAGWAVASEAPEAPVAAAAAKARATDAAVAACERAIQVHGGIGFTWEHPLHRYYKRALGLSLSMGTAPELRGRVAASLVDTAPTIDP